MKTNDFRFVKSFRIDITNFELYSNKGGQFIVFVTAEDSDYGKHALFFEEKQTLVFTFSDDIDLSDVE